MRKFFVSALCVSLTSTISAQERKTFAWDAPPDPTIQGYQIQVGPSPGVTDQEHNVGNVTTAGVDFQPGIYYVRVRSYDIDSFSEPSNEVQVSITSTIPTCSPTLQVFVTRWPDSKNPIPLFTSNQPIASYSIVWRGKKSTSITFTDIRGCTQTVSRS